MAKKKGISGKEEERRMNDPKDVVFFDQSSMHIFILKSNVSTSETCFIEGKEYPLYKLDTSSASHYAFTKQEVATIQTSVRKKFLDKYNLNK